MRSWCWMRRAFSRRAPSRPASTASTPVRRGASRIVRLACSSPITTVASMLPAWSSPGRVWEGRSVDVCCGLVGVAGGLGARTGGAQGADRTCVRQAETRATAGAFLDGLLSGVARKTGWLLAEQAGLDRPYRIQLLLGRSRWDADALRDRVRADVIEALGARCCRDPTGGTRGPIEVAGQ